MESNVVSEFAALRLEIAEFNKRLMKLEAMGLQTMTTDDVFRDQREHAAKVKAEADKE